jgi:RHS repeat-associated protein
VTDATAYDYTPFGQPFAATGPAASLNPFRFSSEVWDATFGLVQYTFRSYNPPDGRFTTRDPIEENGGLNVYTFAGNTPVDWYDSLGLASGSVTVYPVYMREVVDEAMTGRFGYLWTAILEDSCKCKCKNARYFLNCKFSLRYQIRLRPKKDTEWKTGTPASYDSFPVPAEYPSWSIKQKRAFVEKHERKHLKAFQDWHTARLSEISAIEQTAFLTQTACEQEAMNIPDANQSGFLKKLNSEVRHEGW